MGTFLDKNKRKMIFGFKIFKLKAHLIDLMMLTFSVYEI